LLLPSLVRGPFWPSSTDAASFDVLAILALGVFVPLILALHGTVIVASCKQQHEIFIVLWESV
jgi:hypothetical protein